MRYLILTDIHGNLEALEAVAKDAKGKYDRAISCGDLCDYGPDSNAVIDWCRENLSTVIRGNHDRVCSGLDSVDQFTDLARTAARWTMEQLTPRNRKYLRDLPMGPRLVDDSLVLVHGSPRDEDEYLTNMSEVSEIFALLRATDADELPIFFGHTHLQGAWVSARGRTRGVARPLLPTKETLVALDPGAAYLVNPGSVGQPRDSDPRAAYAIFDAVARTVGLRRVPYDFMKTERKIVAAGLPEKLGFRLALGR